MKTHIIHVKEMGFQPEGKGGRLGRGSIETLSCGVTNSHHSLGLQTSLWAYWYCGWGKGQIRGSETSRRLFSFWQELMGPDLGGMGKSESEQKVSQFSSAAQSCLTLCDPMNHSTPGLPVHHQLPEFTQTHIHRVGDAIQPLILCRPLLLLSTIPLSIRVFSNKSTLLMRWPKYWSFSFSIIPSKEHPGLISFRMDWFDLFQSKGLSRVFSNTTVQKHQFYSAQLSL